MEKVRPEAACKTCCLEGMIDRPNFARKSIPYKGVATAASKNSKSKVWSEKQTEERRKPQAGMVLPLAPTRCGPEGGSVETCGEIDREAPESTQKTEVILYIMQKN